jgi:hypothetical protein
MLGLDECICEYASMPCHASTLQDPSSSSSSSSKSRPTIVALRWLEQEQEQEIIIAPSGAQAGFLSNLNEGSVFLTDLPPAPASVLSPPLRHSTEVSCEIQSSQERRANISQPLLSHERRAQLMMRLTIFKGNRQDKVEQVTSSFIMENKPSRPSHQERA